MNRSTRTAVHAVRLTWFMVYHPSVGGNFNGVVASCCTSQQRREDIVKAPFRLAGKRLLPFERKSLKTQQHSANLSLWTESVSRRVSVSDTELYDHAWIHLKTLRSCDQSSDSFTLKMEAGNSSVSFVLHYVGSTFQKTVFPGAKLYLMLPRGTWYRSGWGNMIQAARSRAPVMNFFSIYSILPAAIHPGVHSTSNRN
jgi:hypothetical protein